MTASKCAQGDADLLDGGQRQATVVIPLKMKHISQTSCILLVEAKVLLELVVSQCIPGVNPRLVDLDWPELLHVPDIVVPVKERIKIWKIHVCACTVQSEKNE